ncbi:MAG: hypothetical protein U9R79_20905 [Armatimonadota bacterium]|nr:hypothetical protein [Armatimonadota bacterium]
MGSDIIRRFAHQLRSLLTSVGAAAEYMLQNDLDAGARTELLTMIAEQSSRIDGLLDDFVVVAGSEGGANPGEMAAVDLYNVARQVVRKLAAEAHSLGAWLVLDAGGGLPQVMGDHQQLRHVVTSTTRAVMGVSRPGERVLLELEAPTGGSCQPSVELAVRVESTDEGVSARAQGLSLEDLSLDAARRICEGHGGTVELMESQPGIVCSLPAASQHPRPTAAAWPATALATIRAHAS